MTRNNEAGSRLEDIALKLRCGGELVSAVSDCISDGPNAPETYSDALFGAVQYLRGIYEQMADLVNERLGGDGSR